MNGFSPPLEATITRADGWLFRWHATYTDGLFFLEARDFAITRRGILRKARRRLARMQRRIERRANAETVTADGMPSRGAHTHVPPPRPSVPTEPGTGSP